MVEPRLVNKISLFKHTCYLEKCVRQCLREFANRVARVVLVYMVTNLIELSSKTQ